ncbi:MAG: methyltransferase [Gemmobacter sp.]
MAGLAGAPAVWRPGLIQRLAMSRRFQAWAARTPLLRRFVAREGAELFELIQGFVRSQALLALVDLDLFAALSQGPKTAAALAPATGLTPDRMAILLQAGAALGLLKRRGDTYALSRRGAAFLGVPGLSGMVRHHAVLYRDLADPVAFLRGGTSPDLARFWPYVFGAAAAQDPAVAATYSTLMADSQTLVAEDTLRLVDLSGTRHLMDVGGGTGAFLRAVAEAYPAPQLTLFDLPAVLDNARPPPRIARVPGSFRDDPLPPGADTITLVRVLYDHADPTVRALLARVHAALPPGGQVIVSEPMGGGARPDPATDVYFAFYCMAMGTGRTRSAAQVAGLLQDAGFVGIRHRPGLRPYVTGVVTATRA